MAALGERRPQLLHRDVGLFGQETEDQRRLRLDPAGPPVAAERPGPDVALTPFERPPSAHARGADPEPRGCLAVTGSVRHRGDNPCAEIDRERFRHVCRPPYRQTA
jgi:hypothetical protein